ncbi:hypothetical protein [endosymbiont GvMRE of Glomus versiforme]|uniref:hypothetical protein n=1 Tax=endosymbiont GvMRE of Glomus versiforme TaxID=2039283 RepID=UPI000EBC88DF|nr:hypothetical protein [endosymbiont GvMRE of Glomus versiforme]RHZ35779.1 hypothetical protein GvMRE_Ic5g57 [endosymbiont GvMRE of Glomus versiforme]
MMTNKECQLNHYSLTELWQQATEQIKADYLPNKSLKCFDCHNYERNYKIMTSLLEK